MDMRTEPVSGVLGVRLIDFDITRPATHAEQRQLRALLVEHHLLLIRGQAVTADDQSRFVANFGPVHTRDDGMKETYVANLTADGEPTSRTGTARLLWHQDGTYGARPGIATCLWAQEVAAGAVPTQFANAVRALDNLSADLRAQVEDLHAVHLRDMWDERTDVRWREADADPTSPPDRYVRWAHPIAYHMPHQDRRTLLVHELMTSHVVNMAAGESEALIQRLFTSLYVDDNVYEHVWQTNDVVIWDNLALHHCRPAEMGLPVRRLRRQTIDGWYSDAGLVDWPETVAVPAYARTAS
jgi:taurine dioxygenase